MDYTNKDYEGFRTSMIEELQSRLPEYTDNSSSDAGIVILELLAYGLDILSYYTDVLANEVFMDTSKERESVIDQTKRLGYTMLNSIPAKFYQVFEITPQGTDFTIPAGFRVKTKSSITEESQYFETDEELIISAGDTGLEQTGGEYNYKVSVTHGYTIAEDILGTSQETPNQEFKLNNFPVIDTSIQIAVNEGTGFVDWVRVDNFIYSSPTSPHYILITDDNDEFTIKFGNGNVGKIPTTYLNGIVATYRIGGGTIGNVGANTIIQLDESLAGVIGTFNPEDAYVYGKEKEGLEEAKINAVAQSQTLGRAVTLEDYENLAKLDWKVRQVKASWVEAERTIKVYMLPEIGDTYMSIGLTLIDLYFSERKVLGTLVEIYNPTYVPVDITIDVKLLASYTSQSASIESQISSIVDEMTEVGVNNFGSPFIPSAFIAEIMSNVVGVQSIYITDPVADVPMLDSQIFTKGTVTINIT